MTSVQKRFKNLWYSVPVIVFRLSSYRSWHYCWYEANGKCCGSTVQG